MTALDLIPEEDLRTERMTEPPKRWRNWWISSATFTDRNDGDFVRRGDLYQSPRCWPSKEVAEQKARDSMERGIGSDDLPMGRAPDVWVGAFPEGERP